MTYRADDLRKIMNMKDNGIKDCYMMVKREIIDLLREKQLLPPIKESDSLHKYKYKYLQDICNNPRKVIIEDIETGEIATFPSMWKASKELHKKPGCIAHFRNETMEVNDKDSKVTISDPEKSKTLNKKWNKSKLSIKNLQNKTEKN